MRASSTVRVKTAALGWVPLDEDPVGIRPDLRILRLKRKVKEYILPIQKPKASVALLFGPAAKYATTARSEIIVVAEPDSNATRMIRYSTDFVLLVASGRRLSKYNTRESAIETSEAVAMLNHIKMAVL